MTKQYSYAPTNIEQEPHANGSHHQAAICKSEKYIEKPGFEQMGQC
jgi:hypothetical protein